MFNNTVAFNEQLTFSLIYTTPEHLIARALKEIKNNYVILFFYPHCLMEKIVIRTK